MYDYRPSTCHRDRGERVVSHVLDYVKEPAPDFVKMSKVIGASLQIAAPTICERATLEQIEMNGDPRI